MDCMESNMETYITICKYIANGNLQYDSGNSNRSSESTLRGGMGGRWEGGSRGKGYMYTYG